MFKDCKNSKKQGDIGIGYAIRYLSEIGTVSIPLTDSQDYDLVVEINNKLQKVQVKTTSYKGSSNSFKVNISVKGGNRSYNTIKLFDHSKVDYIFVLTSLGDEYFIPTNAFTVKGNLTLSSVFDKYKIK